MPPAETARKLCMTPEEPKTVPGVLNDPVKIAENDQFTIQRVDRIISFCTNAACRPFIEGFLDEIATFENSEYGKLWVQQNERLVSASGELSFQQVRNYRKEIVAYRSSPTDHARILRILRRLTAKSFPAQVFCDTAIEPAVGLLMTYPKRSVQKADEHLTMTNWLKQYPDVNQHNLKDVKVRASEVSESSIHARMTFHDEVMRSRSTLSPSEGHPLGQSGTTRPFSAHLPLPRRVRRCASFARRSTPLLVLVLPALARL